MKTKTLFSFIIISCLSLSLFAQEKKKKAPKGDKPNKEINRPMVKNGKDTRFSSHKKRKFRKPGDDH